MSSTIIHAADLVAKPWANGKGITREVFGRTLADGRMDWLISIADLRVDARFSHLDEVDRVFTLLDGDGIDLIFGDALPLRCCPLIPVSFRGDTATRCRVTARPARAFNVFTKHSGAQAIVSVITLTKDNPLRLRSAPVAIHCALGSVMVGDHLLDTGSTIIEPCKADIKSREATATLIIVHMSDT